MIEPRGLERIALTRLPELQVASGLFRATARIEGVEDETEPATALQAHSRAARFAPAEESDTEQPFVPVPSGPGILGDLGGSGVSLGELGLALWAESRAGGEAIGEIDGLIRRASVRGFEQGSTRAALLARLGLTESSVLTGEPAAGLVDDVRSEILARRRRRALPGCPRAAPRQRRACGKPVPPAPCPLPDGQGR